MPVKISELERITGVPQSTIRYYVKEGLLPQPTKVNKSMAYYDESCVERIALVRELQEKRYYPLSVIKNIISRMDNGISLPSLLSLEDAIFRPRTEGEQRLMSRQEFMAALRHRQGDCWIPPKSSRSWSPIIRAAPSPITRRTCCLQRAS